MKRIFAIIYLAEHALDAARNHDELVAAYEAAAAAFTGLCPARARESLAMAERLREMDRAQMEFRTLLRDVPPKSPQGNGGEH